MPEHHIPLTEADQRLLTRVPQPVTKVASVDPRAVELRNQYMAYQLRYLDHQEKQGNGRLAAAAIVVTNNFQ